MTGTGAACWTGGAPFGAARIVGRSIRGVPDRVPFVLGIDSSTEATARGAFAGSVLNLGAAGFRARGAVGSIPLYLGVDGFGAGSACGACPFTFGAALSKEMVCWRTLSSVENSTVSNGRLYFSGRP